MRSATADAHDRLDGGMERFDLASPRDYAAFLSIQLAAREPIEEWCAAHAPDGLTPPAQSALIRADLADLAFDTPADAPASEADFGEPLGVAWALGGSSLGNRAMLAHLKKRVGNDWPVRFLADEAMPAYWKTLRPTLEGPADAATAEAATHAALAVFARFAAALAAHERQAAA
ncbi:biliverdin-producing heme oxygenase [Pelagerythrobacter sp.]|uniref:biliverdin-producing heme oxygenase n=1 Tax=Pelagerythrobacter sp. TaxID=2800702 RepID=UPI0035AE98C5